MKDSKVHKKRRNVKSLPVNIGIHTQSKKHLTESELEALLKGASKTRYPARNQAIILVMFWHGLRASELCRLQTSDLDLKHGRLFVRRLKNGLSATHPVRPEMLRIVKRYLKQRGPSFRPLFINERQDQFVRETINYILKQSAKLSTLPFHVNPHMLRHGCGFALANRGLDTRLIQDYLGHSDIRNTTIYTRTSAKRFGDIWN